MEMEERDGGGKKRTEIHEIVLYIYNVVFFVLYVLYASIYYKYTELYCSPMRCEWFVVHKR